MKNVRLFSLLVLGASFFSACKGGNNAEEPRELAQTETVQTTEAAVTSILDSARIAAGTAFLEKFYRVYDKDYEEGGIKDDFIKSNITPDLKQWLIDSFDYDCDGECMATWLFCYNGGGDTGPLKVRTIKPEGDAYLVSCRHDQDRGKEYHYSIKLTLVQDGDSFKIDSLEELEDRYTE